MIAASYSETGSSDVLNVGEIETPSPGPGEVRVKLAVAGVNPTDWKNRSGATGGVNFDFQVPDKPGLGVTLNLDVARQYARPDEPFFDE